MDVLGKTQILPSIVVRLQYHGAVYDNTIRVLSTTDNDTLYNEARNIASFPSSIPVSLLRLDYQGEIVTDPRQLNNNELLEIMEGSPDDANVVARMTELKKNHQNTSGSKYKNQADSIKGTIQFLHIVEKLKRTKRTGWVNHGVKPAESIADHMYRMGIMAMLIDEKTAGVDKNKCIKMAIVHDLAESLVGDITPYDGVSVEDKHAQERNAMQYLCHDLLGWTPQAQEISALWAEYEDASTPEALLVKDFDKFEMILQASEYEKSEDMTLEDFFAGTRGKFKHPMVTGWVDELEAERAQNRAIKS
ncbi:HD domain-containing protein 2 [Linnemannia zychae]|nr:HD domain-containing protein 2 [Linnemannia zychae]